MDKAVLCIAHKAHSGKGLFSSLALNTYGTLVYFFCQWLLTVLAARIGGYECAGMFSLAIAFSNIITYIASWGMRGVQVSDVAEEYSNGDFAGARLVTILCAALVFPLLLMLYGYTGELALCCAAAVFYKLLESITDLLFGTMQRQGRYDRIAVSYTLKGTLPAAAFAIFLRTSLPAALSAMTAAYLLQVLLYDLPCLRGCGLLPMRFSRVKALMKKCLPLMLNGMVSAWLVYLPRHSVQRQLGDEMLGYYGSISTVVVVLSTLSGAVWAVLMPSLSLLIREKNVPQLRRTLRKVFLAMLAVAAAALAAGNLLGPWAFALIYGGDIRSYMYLLTPVLLNAILLMAVSFFDCCFIPMGKQTVLLMANAVGLGVCAVTVTAATNAFGALGACCSMTAGLTARLAFLVVFLEQSIRRLSS